VKNALKKYVIISSETIASGEKLEKVAQKKPTALLRAFHFLFLFMFILLYVTNV